MDDDPVIGFLTWFDELHAIVKDANHPQICTD
jgi:hypothetical protein